MREKSNHTLDAVDLRVGLVVSRYHGSITSRLREGAIGAFLAAGGSREHVVVVEAPGAFEIPLLVNQLAERDDIGAVVACGCVITGETTHDQFINQSVAASLASIAIERHKPVAFGILTCQTFEQAEERSGGAKGNKGEEAMRAAIETCRTLESIRREPALKGATS